MLFDLSLETLFIHQIVRVNQDYLIILTVTNQQQVRSCYQTFYILYRSFISSTNLSDERVKCVKSVLGLAWPGVMCSHLQLSSLQSLNPSFHQSQKWISAGIMITISYN